MAGQFDFLQEDMDFSTIEGSDDNINVAINEANNQADDKGASDDKSALGAPTDGVGTEDATQQQQAQQQQQQASDESDDDWDNFVANEEQTSVELSTEDQAQLDLANKTVPGKNFKTIKEFQDYLNNPSGKTDDGTEDKTNEPVTLESKLQGEDKIISQLNDLINKDNEELIKMDIQRQDPNIEDEDLELEIEALRNSGQLNYKAREIKSKLRNQVTLREGNKDKFKEEEENAKQGVQQQNRDDLKGVLKERTKLFDSIDISNDVNKEVYQRVISGKFHDSIRGNHAEIAKLATLQVMEEQIVSAFKSLKQSGHAFESGKHSMINKISNVKPRTQGGSGNPLEELFGSEEGGMSLKEISMDGMQFVEDKK